VQSQHPLTHWISEGAERSKIRQIKSNANCRYKNNWPVKRLCGRCLNLSESLSEVFVWGGLAICRFWIWSDWTPAEYDLQHNTATPPPSRTLSTLVMGGEQGRKVRGAIVHKAGSKKPTWWCVSPFSSLQTKLNTSKRLVLVGLAGHMYVSRSSDYLQYPSF
jgi:hypothetical protein